MTRVSSQQRQALQDAQSALVASILNGTALTRGNLNMNAGQAQVYRRNIVLMARNALEVSFPTVRGLLGPEAFEQLAIRLLDRDPPYAGDWGLWGRSLPAVLCRHEAAGRFPFLVPAARLDWRVHCAGRSAATPLQQSTLQLLQTEDLEDLTIDLSSHCSLLSSRYPLIGIREWQHNQALDPTSFTVSEAPRRLLVFRPQYKVVLRYLRDDDYQFLLGLKQSRSLADLLEQLLPDGFDFPGWMDFAIRNQLIYQVRTLS
jgi:hypothetical protein